MSHRSAVGRTGRTLLERAVVLGLALVVSTGLRAQTDDPGDFAVESAWHELVDGTYLVSADIDLRLSTDAENALHMGLPLTIRVEAECMRRLPVWWDMTVGDTATRRSQLRYERITDRYLVLDIDSGLRKAFKTLSSALEHAGRVDRLEVIDAADLDDDRRYDFRVRALLDKNEFPGALALVAFWQRDWQIASDWVQWRSDNE